MTLQLIFRQFQDAVNPADVLTRLFGESDAQIWLDSSNYEAGSVSIVVGTGGPLSQRFVSRANPASPNIFDRLAEQLHVAIDVPQDWKHAFTLGWVGALGYDARHHSFDSTTLAHNPSHQSALPDVAMIFADRGVVIDHDGTSHLIALLDTDQRQVCTQQQQWLDWAASQIAALAAEPSDAPSNLLTSKDNGMRPRFVFDQNKQDYLDSIAACKEFIAAGDSYEICLTNTATGPALRELFPTAEQAGTQQISTAGTNTALPPELVAYLRLRETSPVPYGAYLSFSEANTSGATSSSAGKSSPVSFTILSASPERFLQVSPQGKVSAKPIKGTRPRGDSAHTDERIRRELASNTKDQAENLMIVDLLRNDLGRVCKPGSVRVPKIFDVETYSHVHQLVSTIEGQLEDGLGAVDVLAASFPGGSMTGAPKIRTMEIIDQLERRARGFYSGAIGWLSPNGAADLSITIRTLVDDGEHCTFGVGGAIVTDSDPEAEYQEILTKASALLEALGAELQGLS